MSQCDIILKAMLENRFKKVWTAKDFQSGKYFVGYEATARMSDLLKMYPDLVIAGKDGRFRTLSINWKCKDIKEFEKRLNIKRLRFC